MADFAILAPVPAQHLESGLEVVLTHDYVSFGSQKWELFREIDKLRGDGKVAMLLYPSHESDKPQLVYEICWVGWYVGHVQDIAQKLEDQNKGHRPPSTAQYEKDNADGWAVFWRIEGLRELPGNMRFPIGRLESYKSGYWRKKSPPFGPEIVAYSNWMNDLFISSMETETSATDTAEPPERISSTIRRIIRDTTLANQLKQRYEYHCQLCGTRLEIASGKYYAEAHHIRPLGGEHKGTDTSDNLLVLCPNHHALFDYGVPYFVSTNEIEIAGQRHFLTMHHHIREENCVYHNELLHIG